MSLYRTDNRSDAIFMPLNDQLSRPVPDRHSPTIHVKKYRKVRVTQSRASPVRSVSTPATQCYSSAPEKARDKITITRCSLPIDSACVSSFAQGMANHPTYSGHSQPMSEQISTFSSRSNSGSSQWSGPNPLSSTDCSMTDMSGLFTPSLTFDVSDGLFYDPHFAESDSTSSLNSEVPALTTDKLVSLPDAYSIPHSRHRPALWVDTTFEGRANEICESPVESDTDDSSPYSRADGSIFGHHDRVKLRDYDAPPTCGGKKGTFPDYVNDCDVSNTCGVASVSSSEDGLYQQVSPPWCKCHWLLNRPTLASPQSGEILEVCSLYSQKMRDSRLLRRLQDEFEIVWQKIRIVVPSLQKQVQWTLIPMLDTPPTLRDGLITLSLLSDDQPLPSLHGYISLAFFAKAWLSLGQHVTSNVTNSLFSETSCCVAAEASPAEQEAYEYLLQLLWQPVNAVVSPQESRQLFCPTLTQMNDCTTKCNSGTNTRSPVPSKGILGDVCRDIIDVLVNRSPNFGVKGPLELLPPAVRNSRAYSTGILSKKITWLIDAINSSKNGGLVTHCPDCGEWFTGRDRVKNRNKHMTSNCPVTGRRQRVICQHCGVELTRLDNLYPHIRRKHPSL